MQQSDSFYEELPFTLQEEHLKSEILIFGTGLKESLLAAYFSKMDGKQVLIFDQQKSYGSCLKTLTLKQLYSLSTEQQTQNLFTFIVPKKYEKSNEQFFNQRKQKNTMRGFNIDIQPSFFMGTSLTCECLKQADMDKYLQFRTIYHLLNYQQGKLLEVPLSKGKIFDSKSLSLMEKKKLLSSLHILMRLYQQQMGVEEDMNSTKQFDKNFGLIDEETLNLFKQNRQNLFVSFLQKITKKSKKIMDLIAYVICGYQYDYSKVLPQHVKQKYNLKNMIERFGKFISSCGVYGQSPYLYVDNGVGDIPQAFSRVASIFGSTFVLHPKINVSSIKRIQGVLQDSQIDKKKEQQNKEPSQGQNKSQVINKQNSFIVTSNIAPGKQIHPKRIFYGQTFSQLYSKYNQNQQFHIQKIFNLLVFSKKIGNQVQCPSICYFMGSQKFENPVSMFIFDDSTHACPSGHILYQFSTILKEELENEVQQKAQVLIGKLKQVRGEEFESSILFVTSYIRENKIIKNHTINTTQTASCLLRGYEGLDLEGHFQQLVQIVGKKDNYFRKKNPYQQENDFSEEEDHNDILQKLENIQIAEKNKENQTQKIESDSEAIDQNAN